MIEERSSSCQELLKWDKRGHLRSQSTKSFWKKGPTRTSEAKGR